MNHPHIADFYHGWLIEVVRHPDGYVSTGYSPCRKRVTDSIRYGRDFDAVNAAKQQIDRHLACCQLTTLLRDVFEAGRLSFEEWRSLNQSLMQPTSVS